MALPLVPSMDIDLMSVTYNIILIFLETNVLYLSKIFYNDCIQYKIVM